MQVLKPRYTEAFFDETQLTSMRSARQIVPLILDRVAAESVIDIGCGTGSWLSIFRKNGVRTIAGIDNASLDNASLQIPKECVLRHDLTEPFSLETTYDLVTCLEVAEHLPASCADQIVENLTNLGPVVLFSAAIPHQGGTGHINEQWPEYWAGLFARRGYRAVDAVRETIWKNDDVAYWYAQNLIFYVKESTLDRYPQLAKYVASTNPERLTLIHPKTYVKNYKSLKGLGILRFGWNLLPRWLRLRLIRPLGELIWKQVGTNY